jgi:hypothetical protein
MAAAVHEQGPFGVDHGAPVQDRLHASRMRFDEDNVVGQR